MSCHVSPRSRKYWVGTGWKVYFDYLDDNLFGKDIFDGLKKSIHKKNKDALKDDN